MNLEIYQVDAFTKVPFAGNPAAVVPLESWLPDETMQQIAAENNLAETAFFVKNGDVYDLRWFTPQVEVNLCGHATLATSFVIFNCLELEDREIKFRSHRSGPLGVSKVDDLIVLDFPAYPLRDVDTQPDLVGTGFPAPIGVWASQKNMLLLRLSNEDEVRSLKPNTQHIAQLPYDEVIVTAKGDTADFVSRMFAPNIGIPEDPVTGAIHCSLIPYWANELGKEKLFARQLSARGGEIFCEMAGDRVNIGGNATLYLKGEIYVEAAESKTLAA